MHFMLGDDGSTRSGFIYYGSFLLILSVYYYHHSFLPLKTHLGIHLALYLRRQRRQNSNTSRARAPPANSGVLKQKTHTCEFTLFYACVCPPSSSSSSPIAARTPYSPLSHFLMYSGLCTCDGGGPIAVAGGDLYAFSERRRRRRSAARSF